MALRRWKPFFPAFAAIDAALEAAAGGVSRDKYRQVSSQLVEMLCDVAEDDGVRAEALFRLLDRTMAEALLTLRAVTFPAMAAVLAATGVAKAVAGLQRHDAGMVRALASGVMAQWTAAIEAEAASAKAQDAALLDKLLQMLREHEVAAPVAGGCAGGRAGTAVLQADGVKQAAKISESDLKECPKNKTTPPGVPISGGDRVRNEQTGDAKRKRPGAGDREGEAYVKRQRKVPEEMVEHRPRKMEPAMKSRSRVSSWRSRERSLSTSTRRHVIAA